MKRAELKKLKKSWRRAERNLKQARRTGTKKQIDLCDKREFQRKMKYIDAKDEYKIQHPTSAWTKIGIGITVGVIIYGVINICSSDTIVTSSDLGTDVL